ncbi:Hypothetical protein, putative [Bodo saltans]|uniref:Uncharacterized protein n=1 Tax=Bodo saltans TaxID=75058 RepID=A0A0S4IRT1_BODSA|nr:Hypothetical protein, putative [Bodo saltans]|eukprot:CUG03692.1 Hypothetical protein, putative [Bodo saltans]
MPDDNSNNNNNNISKNNASNVFRAPAFEVLALPMSRSLLLSSSSLTAILRVDNSARWIIHNEVGDAPRYVLTTMSSTVSGIFVVTFTSSTSSSSSNSSSLRSSECACVVIDPHNVTTRNRSGITITVPAPGMALTLAQQVVGSVVLRSPLTTYVAVGAASGGGRLASIVVAQCVSNNQQEGVSGLLPLLGSSVMPSHCTLSGAHGDDVGAIVGNWGGSAGEHNRCIAYLWRHQPLVCYFRDDVNRVDEAAHISHVRPATLDRCCAINCSSFYSPCGIAPRKRQRLRYVPCQSCCHCCVRASASDHSRRRCLVCVVGCS